MSFGTHRTTECTNSTNPPTASGFVQFVKFGVPQVVA
ncbi:MAG: hypothetical protein QOI63_1353 [Thermoplasmata archaeon]|jgi:hypothetical protein|nr:hypothetical protein [Thermoplasmata archaeon]